MRIPGYNNSFMTGIKTSDSGDDRSRSVDSFVVDSASYDLAQVSNFSEYWDIKTVGDIDWCYTSKHGKFPNHFQFSKPKYKYVKRTNHKYGASVIWLPIVAIVLLIIACIGGRKYYD